VRLHAEQQATLAGRDRAAEVAQLVRTGGLHLLDGASDARPRLLLLHLPDLIEIRRLGRLAELRLRLELALRLPGLLRHTGLLAGLLAGLLPRLLPGRLSALLRLLLSLRLLLGLGLRLHARG
jgi:hypothetical protein